MPNYIAEKIILPELNILLYTDESKNQLPIYQKIFKEQIPFELPAWNFEKICEIINHIFDQYKEHQLILNFTAGNKIMSQAAFDCFRSRQFDCYYINTERNEYLHFNFRGKSISTNELNVKCELKDIFRINDQKMSFQSFSNSEETARLSEIVENNTELQEILNQNASKFNKDKPLSLNIEKGIFKNSRIIYKNNNSNICFRANGETIYQAVAAGDELLRICFGGWFEFVCFRELKNLNYFDEIIHSCTINRRSSNKNEKFTEKNEIDILANKGIYTFIFECKSGNLKASSVDKLVAIKENYIGRYSSTFFITKKVLSKTKPLHKNVLEKVNDNNVVHLVLDDFKNHQNLISIFNQRKNLK